MVRVLKVLTPMSLLILSCLMVISTATPCAAKTSKVRVMGTGNIIEEDTSSAKDQAISNSLVAAVEMVINDIIAKNVVISNFSTINEILYGYTDTFIQGYKVLAEARYEKKYRVMVEAVVSEKKVKSRLVRSGIVIDASDKYKVLFLVSENNLEDLSPQFWWGKGKSYVKTVSDSTLMKEMKKKGFSVIKHRKIPADLIKTPEDETIEPEFLSTEDAVNIGKALGAEIVITGAALAEQTPNTMGEDRSFTGKISVDLLRTDTGEKIGSVSKQSVSVNSDEVEGSRDALTETALLVGNDIAPMINIAMKEEDNKPSMIEVVIEGTNFFINYSKLSKKIRTISGVKRVKQREKRADRAIVVVNYIGSGQSLAKAIMAETYDNFGLNISEVTRNHIRIEMVPKSSNMFDQ